MGTLGSLFVHSIDVLLSMKGPADFAITGDHSKIGLNIVNKNSDLYRFLCVVGLI